MYILPDGLDDIPLRGTAGLAGALASRLDRHARHAAPVAADRRQGAPAPHAADQPLVARDVLPHVAGHHDLADPAWQPILPDRFRFRGSPADRGRQRRPIRRISARAAAGRRVLRAADGRVDAAGAPGPDLGEAERGCRGHTIPAGRDPPRLRCGRGQPLLAGARAGRPRVQDLPRPLHRQVQPRAPVLGGHGSRGHPLFRPPGAGASGRDPEPARSRDARSLLARGEQLRILGRHRADRLPGVLLVRLSVAGRVSRRAGAAGRGVLQQGLRRVRPACTIACASRRRPTRRSWSSCSPPTSLPPIWPGGIGLRWNARCSNA